MADISMRAMETATLKNPDAKQLPRELCDSKSSLANTRIGMIYPRRGDGSNWPWISRIGPMSQWAFESYNVDNVFAPFPKATWLYRKLQFSQIAQQIKSCDLTFLFSTDIAVALAYKLAKQNSNTSLIYVGFTQDGSWPAKKVRKIARSLKRCDVVTMFSEQERKVYITRFRLSPQQAVVIPIHTDEINNYSEYSDVAPEPKQYILTLGSPNRSFTLTAQICKKLGLPLVIITRPWHTTDSLSQLASLGAKIITNADKLKALTYLKHAKLAVMPFVDDSVASGFSTIMHAMFMRTPMVATQCLGVSEHIIDGETGFVTPHNDSKSLLYAIDRLWSQPGLAQSFGEAALRRAEQRHSHTAAAEQFSKLINKTLSLHT